MITRKIRILVGIQHKRACSIERLNNLNKREHYIENLKTTEQITVDIAGHVIGIYVFLRIVALDNLFDNGCI